MGDRLGERMSRYINLREDEHLGLQKFNLMCVVAIRTVPFRTVQYCSSKRMDDGSVAAWLNLLRP